MTTLQLVNALGMILAAGALAFSAYRIPGQYRSPADWIASGLLLVLWPIMLVVVVAAIGEGLRRRYQRGRPS